ncbi:uncharacterized protein G2W53_042984 [Senna tora]|uniref:Uncharacterized protein n=1 Tax=Senna tora TaxID=362788 RepID=A0A834SGY9_9FABA|nr:uncharacterized protein G2W53_042984 [Senna tora]
MEVRVVVENETQSNRNIKIDYV